MGAVASVDSLCSVKSACNPSKVNTGSSLEEHGDTPQQAQPGETSDTEGDAEDQLAAFLSNDFKEAVKVDDVQLVCDLLDKKANVNFRFMYGLTPLHLAALHGSLGVTKVLLCANADACAVTTDNQRATPRSIAEQTEQKAILDIIMQVSEGASKAVTLHIYDLGSNTKVQAVNNMLSTMGTGAFHVGVEVFGTEYSFGYNEFKSISGIFACPPRQNRDHTYRESVPMGHTPLTEKAVEVLISDMAPKWKGSSYNLLTRNCTHFCDSFCEWLAVDPVPEWLMSLAAAGAKLSSGVTLATRAAIVAADAAKMAAAQLQSMDKSHDAPVALESEAPAVVEMDHRHVDDPVATDNTNSTATGAPVPDRRQITGSLSLQNPGSFIKGVTVTGAELEPPDCSQRKTCNSDDHTGGVLEKQLAPEKPTSISPDCSQRKTCNSDDHTGGALETQLTPVETTSISPDCSERKPCDSDDHTGGAMEKQLDPVETTSAPAECSQPKTCNSDDQLANSDAPDAPDAPDASPAPAPDAAPDAPVATPTDSAVAAALVSAAPDSATPAAAPAADPAVLAAPPAAAAAGALGADPAVATAASGPAPASPAAPSPPVDPASPAAVADPVGAAPAPAAPPAPDAPAAPADPVDPVAPAAPAASGVPPLADPAAAAAPTAAAVPAAAAASSAVADPADPADPAVVALAVAVSVDPVAAAVVDPVAPAALSISADCNQRKLCEVNEQIQETTPGQDSGPAELAAELTWC